MLVAAPRGRAAGCRNWTAIGPQVSRCTHLSQRKRPANAGLFRPSGRQDAKRVVGGLSARRGRFRGQPTPSPQFPDAKPGRARNIR
jgi:hypothetical protein